MFRDLVMGRRQRSLYCSAIYSCFSIWIGDGNLYKFLDYISEHAVDL